MRFVINRKKLKELAAFRGWRAIYTPLAQATGFSTSYCRRVILGQEKLTEGFMLKYIQATGVNPNSASEWSCLFDLDLKPIPDGPGFSMGLQRTASPEHYFRNRRDGSDIEIQDVREYLKVVNAKN